MGQLASFALDAQIPAENLLRAMNRALPQSIRVLQAEKVAEEFHARHSATGKTYEYRIFERKLEDLDEEQICPPFLAPFVWDCRWPLKMERMQQAADQLCGTHDFSSFQASDPDVAQRDGCSGGPNPVKTIYVSQLVREDGLLRDRVAGSGFLHHMVRNIVGTLVEVGRGSLAPEDMRKILAAKDRAAAGPTAPAQGLFLVSVEYPDVGGVSE